jgi:PKD repeat protein
LLNIKKINYRFISVISNLTIHGYEDFQKQFSTDRDLLNICVVPDYLGANVLDDTSKKLLKNIQYKYYDNDIKQTLNVDYTDVQRNNLTIYIKEFSQRRQLDLNIFPENFREWLNA